ncbi:MAG: hypothetical protein BWZ10_01181 [candidate division BRC1 bacterium ADurb.BinA364]|nr:MAG: hypothetical protein BWZ10_01181 [candidate division BRC1 bacterium ADurb.BinA364]
MPDDAGKAIDESANCNVDSQFALDCEIDLEEMVRKTNAPEAPV